MSKAPSGAWHVYLLNCADGTLYCGITNDLERRLDQHNQGKASKYTRVRLPLSYATHVRVADKSAALKLEIAVKKRPRAEKIHWLESQAKREG